MKCHIPFVLAFIVWAVVIIVAPVNQSNKIDALRDVIAVQNDLLLELSKAVRAGLYPQVSPTPQPPTQGIDDGIFMPLDEHKEIPESWTNPTPAIRCADAEEVWTNHNGIWKGFYTNSINGNSICWCEKIGESE